MSLRGNFKLINQERESNGQEMAATESVLSFGAESRASDDRSNVTVVRAQRELFASSACLFAELYNADYLFCVLCCDWWQENTLLG